MEEEEAPEEMKELMQEGFCTNCAFLPCLCDILEIEMKLKALKNCGRSKETGKKKRKRQEEEEEEVGHHDPQPAAQQEGVKQQLHHQVLGVALLPPMQGDLGQNHQK